MEFLAWDVSLQIVSCSVAANMQTANELLRLKDTEFSLHSLLTIKY